MAVARVVLDDDELRVVVIQFNAAQLMGVGRGDLVTGNVVRVETAEDYMQHDEPDEPYRGDPWEERRSP